jgi:hypothetical protein
MKQGDRDHGSGSLDKKNELSSILIRSLKYLFVMSDFVRMVHDLSQIAIVAFDSMRVTVRSENLVRKACRWIITGANEI